MKRKKDRFVSGLEEKGTIVTLFLRKGEGGILGKKGGDRSIEKGKKLRKQAARAVSALSKN